MILTHTGVSNYCYCDTQLSSENDIRLCPWLKSHKCPKLYCSITIKVQNFAPAECFNLFLKGQDPENMGSKQQRK